MSDPCDDVITDPKPPSAPVDPTWGGAITSGTTTNGIAGATVRLFQCDGQTSTEVDDTTTDSNGDYQFSGFDPGFYYYAQADMTGPLSGMSVASGSENPTAALPVGPSQSGVDMAFV